MFMQMFIERALTLIRGLDIVHLYFRGLEYFEFEYLDELIRTRAAWWNNACPARAVYRAGSTT
jgi:hypothetical protein